jgi:glycosyltransferase involved in cell wall biosynthesis
MKIAYFTDSYLPNINGVAVAVEVFARRLSEKHQLEIYAPTYTGRTGIERHKNLVVRRCASVPLPTYKDFRLAVPSVTSIAKSFDEFDPDVVHIHGPGALGLVGILMAKSRRKPLVGTYHTLLSEALMYVSPKKLLEKYLTAIDKAAAGLGVDMNLLGNGGSKKSGQEETLPQKMVWSLVNRVYGYADLTLCPSEAIRREIIRRGMKKKVGVLSNGIELSKFPAKTEYVNKQWVLHVGRLGFEKNVGVILRAFARVGQKMPEAKLTIAGDGPAKQELVKLASDLVIEDKVEFLGIVPREELSGIYQSHDVFVTASTMETQGLVILEAMASGLPVIGVNKYAIPDLVKNWRNGFVEKPGDDKGIAEKITKLLNDEKLIERMGREGRRMVGEHDFEKVLTRLEGIYKDLPVKDQLGWWQRLANRFKIGTG